MQDPLAASKALVEHALARFSTDNLSCMVVRLDKGMLQDVVDKRVDPIGVEGDKSTQLRGGVTEAEAILGAAKAGMPVLDAESQEELRRSTEMIAEEQEQEQEPGPEVDASMLDPGNLIRAKEKAAEGKAAVGDA